MNLIRKYFPDVDEKQLHQLSLLSEYLTEWNSKINLVSRKDIPHLEERHLLHSLAIAKIIKFEKGTRIMDAGTGGGFPGLPLAIMFPECEFTLVDSIGKKIKVVADIREKMNLSNVDPVNSRAEKIDARFHFIVSRAVTSFPAFYNLVKNKISSQQFNPLKNGILYLKGGDFSSEINSIGKRIRIFEIHEFFREEFFETKKIIYLQH